MNSATFYDKVKSLGLKFGRRCKRLISNLEQRYIGNIKLQKITFIFILSFMFLLIYKLNANTPLVADDYNYSFVSGETRLVGSLGDVIKSQYHHYFAWGGRSVVHVLAQSFLLWGKPIFNIINSIGYVVLVLLIYFHANTYKKIKVSLLIVINFLIWFFVLDFGQTVLWVTGSANYMWGTTIILSYLLPYRLYAESEKYIKDKAMNMIFFFILGLLAGWTNENTAGAMILLSMFYLLFYKFKNLKIPKYFILGLIGTIIGYLFMTLAPGNKIRLAAQQSNDHSPFIKVMIGRFLDITHNIYHYMFLIIFIFIVLLALHSYFGKNEKIKNSFISVFYIIVSFAALYAMILSPYFPPRAWFGAFIYMIIGICILYSNLNFEIGLLKQLIVICICFTLLLFIPKYISVYREAVRVNNQYKERINYILQQKAIGNMDVSTPYIYTGNPYMAAQGLSDIHDDSKYWTNEAIAMYFGIKSLKGK